MPPLLVIPRVAPRRPPERATELPAPMTTVTAFDTVPFEPIVSELPEPVAVPIVRGLFPRSQIAPFWTVAELPDPDPLPTFALAPTPATYNWQPESNRTEFPLEPAPPTDSTPPQVITAEFEITTEFPDAEERLPMRMAPLLDHNTLEPLSTSMPWLDEALLLPSTNWLLVTLASPT